MKPSVLAQSLDGRHPTAVTLDAQHQAREDRAIVEQDRARAALAEFAAVFRAAQIQIFTQDFQQRFVRREGDLGRVAVHAHRDVGVWHVHPFWPGPQDPAGVRSNQPPRNRRPARRRAPVVERRPDGTSVPSS